MYCAFCHLSFNEQVLLMGGLSDNGPLGEKYHITYIRARHTNFTVV